MNKAIYLDNNATTRIDPDVVAEMHGCLLDGHVNPASQHLGGQRTRKVLEDARERIAAILNVDISSPASDRLVFTSGGTEANNLAVRGLGKVSDSTHRFVVVSSLEHPSILAAAEKLSETHERHLIRSKTNGSVDLDELQQKLMQNVEAATMLISVMMGNNETGVLQPIPKIAELCAKLQTDDRSGREYILHTDAIQVVGKLPVDFQDLGVSAMSISAHKFHGPVGIGALAVRKGVPLSPLLHGGSQQLKLRPGTESVAAAVGMAAALEKWKSEAADREAKLTQLRNRFEQQLHEELDDIVINGAESDRLPHTTNVSFLGTDRQALLMSLDFAGIQCSSGSACESGSSQPSHVLMAMGLPEESVSSAIRFSLGSDNSAVEIEEAVRRISKCVKGLRKSKSSPFSAD